MARFHGPLRWVATAALLLALASTLALPALAAQFSTQGAKTVSLKAAGAVTADQTYTLESTGDWRGIVLVVVVSAVTTGTLTPSVQYDDPASGTTALTWFDFGAIAGTGTYKYLLSPGGAAAGSFTEIQDMPLPMGNLRIFMDKSDASSWNYTVSLLGVH